MTASAADQEREIKDLIHRAERNPDKKGNLRRDVLKRLIDLTHSQHSQLKRLAAGNLKFFFKDFPELEDDVINAVYDLCEDQVSQVRIEGYRAIVQVSRAQPKWVKRNADVLVQLLQSDEPEEVLVVKKGLCEHLDLDPVVTLGVLCDQIIPSDEPLDDEEQSIRDRLRMLVLAFLTSEAKRAIVERHANTPGSDSEIVVVNGMSKAIAKLPPGDTDIIVKDILLSLPSFASHATDLIRGNSLLQLLLNQAKLALKGELPSGSSGDTNPSSLPRTQHYLSISSFVAIEKRVADPLHLLRYYCTNLMGKITLQRLSREARLFIVVNVANTLAACEVHNTASDQLVPLRNQVVEACPSLLEPIAKCDVTDTQAWKACQILLQACKQRKEKTTWLIPAHLANGLRILQVSVDQWKADDDSSNAVIPAVQSLIRSLLEPAKAPPIIHQTSGTSPTSNSAGATTNASVIPNKRKHSESGLSSTPTPLVTIRRESIPTQPRAAARENSSSVSMSGSKSSGTVGQTTSTNSTTPGNGNWSSLPKRPKKGGDLDRSARVQPASRTTPSLLSRMESSPQSTSSMEPPRKRQEMTPSKPRADVQRSLAVNSGADEPDKHPVIGFSIRGAASAASMSTHAPQPSLLKRTSSLLDRLGGSNDADGNGMMVDSQDWRFADGSKKMG